MVRVRVFFERVVRRKKSPAMTVEARLVVNGPLVPLQSRGLCKHAAAVALFFHSQMRTRPMTQQRGSLRVSFSTVRTLVTTHFVFWEPPKKI
jgi:hypothetical protein